MSKRKLVAGGLCAAGTVATLAYVLGLAHAAGIPTMAPVMTYSGTLTDPSGTPLTGTKNIQLQMWDRASGGTTPACLTASAAIPLAAGSFQIPLPDTCTAAARAAGDLWVEILVDGASLGRTKLGAVPFAVEADHAVSATNATKVPFAGVTGVPVSLQANNGSIQVGGGNRTLTAGNEAGNLHIDSAFGSTAGYLYLNYYAGKGTIFGNGSGAAVGSIDASGTLAMNGLVTANGMIGGIRGGAGAYIRDRAGDNGVSFEWTGSALQIYVEDVLVKNFIIPHPTDTERYLVHTTLEGPENAVFYRGTAHLRGGVAEISLPSYFEAATRRDGRTVIVTPKFEKIQEPVSGLAASKVRDGAFLVRGIDDRNPEQAFDWEVKAVRADAAPLVAEPLREDIVVRGDGPYKYFSAKRR